MVTKRLRGVVLLTGSLLLANCREQPLSYSSAPGFIDREPDTFWGANYPDIPPDGDGRPFDPTGGLGVQKFADQLIGKRIATFAGHRWDALRSGVTVDDFFTPPEAGPGPGICTSRRFEISSRDGGTARREVAAGDGAWLGNVYAIAGSVAPLPSPRPGYDAHLLEACRKRSDMDMWYSAPPGHAYLAARLADAVIASARQRGVLPFALRCRPYLDAGTEKPQCEADVRGSVASINPRAILAVDDCFDAQSANCLAIQFPKTPERSTKIEDRWTLNLYLEKDGRTIQKVDVEDTQLNTD